MKREHRINKTSPNSQEVVASFSTHDEESMGWWLLFHTERDLVVSNLRNAIVTTDKDHTASLLYFASPSCVATCLSSIHLMSPPGLLLVDFFFLFYSSPFLSFVVVL